MTLRRLYVPKLPEGGGVLALDQTGVQHARVLRLRPGDEIELFDGTGCSARARILSMTNAIECEVSPPIAAKAPRTRMVLMLAIPKGSKLDDCVRMATELGVDAITLMQAERSVPRWDEARARSRLDRLTRIAAEAAAQCERSDIPIIDGPKPCAEWLRAIPAGVCGVVFGARAKRAFTLPETPEQVWCAIGPEGGFTDAELAAFSAAGFRIASLGPWILRVDTAVSAALALVQDRLTFAQAR
jgi:16S rRNA (uracil1498-N3)-methyltransferase